MFGFEDVYCFTYNSKGGYLYEPHWALNELDKFYKRYGGVVMGENPPWRILL